MMGNWPFDVDQRTALQVLLCIELLKAGGGVAFHSDVVAMLMQRYGITDDEAQAAIRACDIAGVTELGLEALQ